MLPYSLGQGRGRKISSSTIWAMMLAKISVESSDDDAADDFPKLGRGITEPQKEKNSKMTTQMAQDHHPMLLLGNR